MTESLIVHSILKAWGAHPSIRIWRQSTGVAQLGDRTVRFGVPGQADISGLILLHGRRLEIECKSATGRQSDEQKTWERMITKFGGLYVLARSVGDVDHELNALGIYR